MDAEKVEVLVGPSGAYSGGPSKVASPPRMDGKIDNMAMSRFVLLIAFVACAQTPVNATDCPPENAAELAAREASNAYQDVKEAGVIADTLADSIAVAVVDSVAYAAYDSLFASLYTIFGPEAAAAFDQYMDAKQAFYAVGTPIDATALSGAFAVANTFLTPAALCTV